WALKRPEEARRRMVAFMLSQSGKPAGWAFGRVSLWGPVTEHENGYRGQFAYPYALRIETPDETVARAVRDEYAIDIEWAGGKPYEKAREKRRARQAGDKAQRESEDRERKAAMARLKQSTANLRDSYEQPARPRWFSLYDITVEQIIEAVRDAQEKSPDGVVTS